MKPKTFSTSFVTMLPTIVIRLGIAGVLAYITGRLIINDKNKRRAVEGRLSNAVFVYLIALKLSLLITNFSSVVAEPVYLLYSWGSNLNIAIGLMVSIGYLGWFILKKSLNQVLDVKFLALSVLSFVGVFYLTSLFIKDGTQVSDFDPSFFEGKKDLNGKQIEIKSDKVIILNFWATWCPPCRAEMPDLNSFATHNKNVNFISINNISSERNGLNGVREFMNERNYGFTVYADNRNEITNMFDVNSFPTTIVISAEGKIIEKKVGVVSESWLAGFIN